MVTRKAQTQDLEIPFPRHGCATKLLVRGLSAARVLVERRRMPLANWVCTEVQERLPVEESLLGTGCSSQWPLLTNEAAIQRHTSDSLASPVEKRKI